jgi:signal transduction histidine kinase
MNPYSLPASIALAVNIALGLIIFFNNPKKLVNQLFTLLVGSMVVWNVGSIIMSNSHSQLTALLGAKLTLTGIFMFPVFFLHFTFVFPRENRSKISPLSHPLLFYIPPVAILTIILLKMQIKMGRIHALNNIFYLRLHDQTTGFYIAYFVLMGMFLLFIVYGIVNLAISLKDTVIARERLQIRYLIFGIIFMVVFGGIIDLVNYFFRLGFPSFFLTGLYTIFISVFFGIAIVKYRLLNIEIVIKRSLLFSTFSVLILTIYILIVKHLSDWLGATTRKQSIVIESLFVLAIVILLMPIKRYIERLIDHLVFPGRTKIQKRMLAFTKTLAHHIKLKEICTQIIDFVEEIFKIKKIAIFLWDETEECYMLQYERNIGENLVLHPADINRWLAGHDDAIQVENIDENVKVGTDLNALQKSGIFLLIPIWIKNELLGCLALGKRRIATKWEMQDMEFLNTLANQAAIAISRALIYEKQQQSERQLLRTEKLVAMGTLSAGMAHEIKNPLHIISGSAETLMNEDLNKDEQEEILQFIVEETDRLNGIVNNFLDFARPKKPEITKCDVVSLVDETLEMISEQAKTLNITIKKHYAKGLTPLYFDPEQLKQVLINIELNALEAMSKTEKRILTVRVSSVRNKQIGIFIKDTGIGIQKTMQSKIFDPFFTTKKNGTGLGLSISHQIMESMGGAISFVSSFGKGTTFTLKLPIQERLN